MALNFGLDPTLLAQRLPLWAPRAVSYLAGAFVLAWALVRVARPLRRVVRRLMASVHGAVGRSAGRSHGPPIDAAFWRDHAPLLGVLLAFTGLVVIVPDWLPVHDHNSFVARSDCARSLVCDQVSRSWSPPAFHLYGLPLRLLPSSPLARAGLSLAFTWLTLGLSYAAMIRFAVRYLKLPRARARNAATWGVALIACHPALLRLTVAGDFWPYNLAALWGAAFAALRHRDLRDPVDAMAAWVLLGVACLGNVVMLTLAPLGLLAYWAWWRPRRAPAVDAASAQAAGSMAGRVAVAVVAGLVMTWVAAYAWSAVTSQTIDLGALPVAHRGVWPTLVTVVTNHLLLQPAYTPPIIALTLLLGLWLLATSARPRRAALPLLYAVWVVEWALSNDVPGLEIGYPTRFLNGHASFFLFGPVIGLGAERLVHWLRDALPQRLGLAVTLVALALVAVSFAAAATESWRLLREPRILGTELVAIAKATPQLPRHTVLLIPPTRHAAPSGVSWPQDPIEAQFPVGDYRYASRMAGRVPARVVRLNDWTPQSYRPGETLLYLGSTLRTFDQEEIRRGRVPETLQRPELAALLQRWRLEPVRTFSVATAQHPLARMRLAADRVPTVELGFYRLTPRRP